MHVLTERRYIFKRRSIKGRVALGIVASAVALGALTISIADARPGGYQRVTSIEEPAK